MNAAIFSSATKSYILVKTSNRLIDFMVLCVVLRIGLVDSTKLLKTAHVKCLSRCSEATDISVR